MQNPRDAILQHPRPRNTCSRCGFIRAPGVNWTVLHVYRAGSSMFEVVEFCAECRGDFGSFVGGLSL